MNRVAYLSLAAVLLAAALCPRGAAASTTVAGGNLGNQTWTPAGSPYIVSGDITVQAGATLTIQAGTDVQFLNGDTQGAGLDTARIELTVDGALAVTGTPANPVTFEQQTGQSSSWYGIVINADAVAATIANATIRSTVRAISSSMTGATLTVTRATIQNVATAGVLINGGPATLDGVIVGQTGGLDPTYGFDLVGAAGAANHVKVLNSVAVGATYGGYISSGNIVVEVTSSTFDRNGYGILLAGTTATVTITNTIVTNSGVTGLITSALGLSISYSDVWNNALNYAGVSAGVGCVSANPQYVGANDYHLQASSICIDSGSATGAPDHDHDGTARPLDGDGVSGAAFDIGAYEFGTGGGTGGAGGAVGAGGTGGAAGGTTGAVGTGGTAGNAGTGGAAGSGGTVSGTGGAAGSSGVGGAAGAGATAGIGGAATGGIGGALAGAGGAAGIGGAATGGVGGATGAGATAGIGGAATGGVGGALAGAGGAAGAAGAKGGTGTGGARDASADGAPDGGAGAVGGSGSGGCGCATGGHPASGWGLGLLAAALLLRPRRARRR